MFFVIEHAGRAVHILGVTTHPDAGFAAQCARTLVADLGERAERFVRTTRESVTDRMPILNEHHPRRVMTEWEEHHNTGRAHMALSGRAQADDPNVIPFATARIHRHQRHRRSDHAMSIDSVQAAVHVPRRINQNGVRIRADSIRVCGSQCVPGGAVACRGWWSSCIDVGSGPVPGPGLRASRSRDRCPGSSIASGRSGPRRRCR